METGQSVTSSEIVGLSSGTVLDGRFAIERPIGTGGMALVFAARHLSLHRRIALKLLRPDLATSGEIVARFLREARALARLTSEHTVTVMDVGTLSSGTPYLTMEYLEGSDFAALLEQRGRLSPGEVLEYTLQVLEGLKEAHDAGIVHRDLKPANLFLVDRPDRFPLVKLIDFGISKILNSELAATNNLTAPMTMLGSPLYMSPEQLCDSSSVDVRSDIWAMGVLMYELLTGRTPFTGSTFPAVIAAISRDVPEPVSVLCEDVPKELERVVNRCLAKAPAGRFACVEDMANALAPLASSPACQVSLARIRKTGTSVPPTSISVLPSARDDRARDARDPGDLPAKSASREAIQRFKRAVARIDHAGWFAVLATGTVLAWAVVMLRAAPPASQATATSLPRAGIAANNDLQPRHVVPLATSSSVPSASADLPRTPTAPSARSKQTTPPRTQPSVVLSPPQTQSAVVASPPGTQSETQPAVVASPPETQPAVVTPEPAGVVPSSSAPNPQPRSPGARSLRPLDVNNPFQVGPSSIPKVAP